MFGYRAVYSSSLDAEEGVERVCEESDGSFLSIDGRTPLARVCTLSHVHVHAQSNMQAKTHQHIKKGLRGDKASTGCCMAVVLFFFAQKRQAVPWRTHCDSAASFFLPLLGFFPKEYRRVAAQYFHAYAGRVDHTDEVRDEHAPLPHYCSKTAACRQTRKVEGEQCLD